MKKNLFSILVAIFITNFVFAADWVQIDEKIYLDASSLSEYNYSSKYDKDLLLSVWRKRLNNGTESWKNLEKSMSKKLWYSKELNVINCTRKEIATKSFAYYDLKENVAINYEYSYLDWQSVIPETIGELEYTLVCSAIPSEQNTIITPDKKNTIITPDGTRLNVKYHR